MIDKKKFYLIIGIIISIAIFAILILLGLLDNKGSKYYNVEFITKNGTKIETQKIKDGDIVIKPEDPTKEGYDFIRWILDDEPYDFNEKVHSNLILVAQWKENNDEKVTYTVKFNTDGGSTISDQIVEEGNKVKKPEDPTKEGYLFRYWMISSLKYDFDSKVTNDVTLVAKWDKDEFATTTEVE